jgi:uncharacterized protein
MSYIPRHITGTLLQCRDTFPATLLIGPRQVGKSTTLDATFPKLPHLTFDDAVLLQSAKHDPNLFFQSNPTPIILDEVQYAPELFAAIKMQCDAKKTNGLFQLTGSQQFHLMKNVTESLAGRIAILELQGLSLREIYRIDFTQHFVPSESYIANRQKKVVPYSSLWKLIHRGSFPALQNQAVDWEIFYRSYVSTYIERDISDLVRVKDKSTFVRFLVAMAARTGQMLNYTNVADEVGVSLETIRNWTSLLESSGIVYLLEPYAPSALKRAIKTPKLFFRDTGLVCYLTKWMTPEVAAIGNQNGNIFETFVISEILKSYSNEGKGYRNRVFYYRGKDKNRYLEHGVLESKEKEIDFIIEENGVLHPIEIKMSANPTISMASAFDVLDAVEDKKRGLGAIICLYDRVLYLREDVVAIPIHYL